MAGGVAPTAADKGLAMAVVATEVLVIAEEIGLLLLVRNGRAEGVGLVECRRAGDVARDEEA